MSIEDLRCELKEFQTNLLTPLLQQLFVENRQLLLTSIQHEFNQQRQSSGVKGVSTEERKSIDADFNNFEDAAGCHTQVSRGPRGLGSFAASIYTDREPNQKASTVSLQFQPEQSTLESLGAGSFSPSMYSEHLPKRELSTNLRVSMGMEPRKRVCRPFTLYMGSMSLDGYDEENDSDSDDGFEIPAEIRLARPNEKGMVSASKYLAVHGRDDTRALILAPTEDVSLMRNVSSTCWTGCTSLSSFVKSSHFENLGGMLVLLSALCMGIETDYGTWASHRTTSLNAIFDFVELVFTVIFTLELILKMYSYGCDFFARSDVLWNAVDCFVVAAQLASTVSDLCLGESDVSTVSRDMRLIRLLRLVRIVRLVRVFRHFQELGTLVSSIVGSLRSLMWTLLLLLLLVYSFSIFFTQVAWISISQGAEDAERLQYWFSSLPRTALTLFGSIVGGISWDEIAHVLIVAISPSMGIIFCIYISVCVFAVLNIVTGVFLEKTTKMAQEGREEAAARQVGDLFKDSKSVTCDEFKKMLKTKDMKDYFKVINVDPSESTALFQLLDVDDSGTLDHWEVVSGLLRLRGSAKALEQFILMRSVHDLHGDVMALIRSLELELMDMKIVMKEEFFRLSHE